ncbi:hypothetical protein HHK36_010373 [Tetracentron sinense]|uniref:Syringolide-induced protein 14-1-1 n=1 Tax=Tetracentron sinense TaxID=13715 RepID=A0A835DMB3_TETSI|nr:hypothetical protein HHK36_010373 [Tetracentron sinense]
MEKSARSKSMILKFLPKAASAVTFQNPPFSPGRDKRTENSNKLKASAGKGFSGPIISIIPAEARRKSKNGSFDAREPTSPKVSCIGQIKQKKKIHKSKRVSPPQESNPVPSPRKTKRHPLTIRSIFGGAKPGRKSDVSAEKPPLANSAPSLSQMKQFSSGRDAFANFEWKAQGVTVTSGHRNYYSDEERGESTDEENEIIIPFSAPIMVGGGVALEPRKEVNLWKRRTMAPPRPLQLKTQSDDVIL